MTDIIRRPAAASRSVTQLMRNDHFQIAYATNDIDRACAIFADRFGISEFRRLEGPRPGGGDIRVELAWVGGTMYELLTASGPGSALYMDRLPESFAIKLHHFGYFIHDDESWEALHSEAARLGYALTPGSVTPGFLKSCFIDAPELGHYLEYIYPEAGGVDFFQNVPAN